MSLLKRVRGSSRRGVVAVVVSAGLVVGATALAPTSGADQVADKQAEAKKVADQLDALQARQMDISAQAERVGYEQQQAQQEVDAAQALLDQTTKDLDQKREEVRKVAVEAYQNGNDSPELDAFLTSDATSAVQKRSYLETRTGDVRDKIDSLSAAEQKAQEDRDRLQAAQDALDTKAGEMQQLKSAADKAVSDQQALNTKVQGELQTLVAAEQKRRQEEAAAQAAQAQRAAAAQRAQQGTQATTTARSGARSAGGSSSSSGSSGSSSAPPPPVGHGASGAIAAALSRVGVGSYVWGAGGPVDFDCSGLVAWAYAQVGVSLPHYSGAQYAMTTRISRDQLQPGDLVFWGGGGSEHVAIYMGGNSLVHAFGSGHGVATTALDGWWKPPTGYGRLNY